MSPRVEIPLSRPDITESDIAAVTAVLRTPHLSLGPKLAAFEEAMAAYIGMPHAVALSSGTAALELCLRALGIGAGDEVILPSFTFIAVANAVLNAGATPVFADIDPLTLNLTAESIAPVVTPQSRAIILVHTFGYPADVDPILQLARRHNLRLIEDACEAIGAARGVRRAGSFGDCGVFSFYPNKPVTCGEGGAVVTRDPALAQRIRAWRNQGRRETDGLLDHSLPGGNYRLPDTSCALGLEQLQRIETILARRDAVASLYCDALRNCPDIDLPPLTVPNGRISWFAFIIRLSTRFGQTGRDRVMQILANEGIGCRPYFPPIHLQPLYRMYKEPRHHLPVTEEIAFRTLALPFFNNLQGNEIDRVCSVLKNALAQAPGLASV